MKLFSTLALLLAMLVGQDMLSQSPTFNSGRFSIHIHGGYDLPFYHHNFDHIGYDGGLKLGAAIDYRIWRGFSLGMDYDWIKNSPSVMLPDSIVVGGNTQQVESETLNINRQFLGIGPGYVFDFSERFTLGIHSRVGLTKFNGGDLAAWTLRPGTGARQYHLLQSGYKNSFHLSSKLKVQADFFFSDAVGLHLGAYYLRHFQVKHDPAVDLAGLGNVGWTYGSTDYDLGTNGEYIVSTRSALVVPNDKAGCHDVSSIGLEAGLTFRFPTSTREKECTTCPDPPVKVIITVVDRPSGKTIPAADVLLRDQQGNVFGAGVSNGFGLAEISNIPAGNYRVEGKVYGIATTEEQIAKDEFFEGVRVIRKTVFYEDLRFILKGKTINKQSRNAEPGVLVRLSQARSGAVKQGNSSDQGAFDFRLEPNAQYELVGIKENRLSEIENASTVGLTRSTTLFVELELGMDNMDCNSGVILDIKYDLAKHYLRPEAKAELNRLVQYLKDHQEPRAELASHTDSRGSDSYNMALSERRAQSAVEYIISQGIPSYRVTARGYGESRLKNRCANGVPCSEADHEANRRTEAILICN